MIYLFTLILLIVLFFIDKNKTIKSIKIGLKKLYKSLPAFINMIIFVAFILSIFNDELILKYLGSDNVYKGILISSGIGSITVMPGFIAFPLAGLLLKKGLSYMVIAAFTNTLMMVGIVSYPFEKQYLGRKITIIRNMAAFFISIVIALIIGLIYKELV